MAMLVSMSHKQPAEHHREQQRWWRYHRLVCFEKKKTEKKEEKKKSIQVKCLRRKQGIIARELVYYPRIQRP
jgi:hypothetical protein